MCLHARAKDGTRFFSQKEADAYDAKLKKDAAEAEQAKHEADARAFQRALAENLAKAKRNMQLVPVEAR